VDAFRDELRDTFLWVREPAVRSHDVRGKQFSTHRPGYDKTQVDAFLEKVVQAISDGVREAHPDSQVECVAVRKASPELIKSTDLLIVGGPTHFGHMTTGFSRKRQVSGEKKAEAKDEPPHELEPDTEGPGLREWFHQLPKAKEGAAFKTRLGSALAGGADYGIAHRLQRHGYYLVKNPEGFVLNEAHGPLHAGEIERAKEWGAQLVRASAAQPGPG
jgi:DivIVA domain-containing protein